MQDKSSENTSVVIEEESEMFYKKLKLKNICGFCFMVLVFHIVLTISISNYSTSNPNNNESIEDIVDDMTNSYVSPQRVRKKRNILDIQDNEDSKLKSPNIITHHKDNINADKKKVTREWQGNRLCQNGHAQDIVTQCEAVGCLRKLHLPPHGVSSYLDGRVSKEFLSGLQQSKGRLQQIHIDIISILTDIQWHHGIFGSVAVLGDNTGLMTKLLAANADISEGENMFIVPGSFQGEDQLESFNILDSSLKQNIHLCPGYSNFSKIYLIQKDIPQFRFVSISLQDNFNVLPHLIQMTTCIIREGGILVVDNFRTDKLKEFVQKYYTINGQGTIKPLLATDTKVYFSSPRWKQIYTEKLLQSHSSVVSLHLQMSKDDLFHSSYKYLSSHK